MDTEDRPYKFFSLAFHKYFLSKVLLPRLRPWKPEADTIYLPRGAFIPSGFYMPVELLVLFAVSTILIAIGLPEVSKHGSVCGWILSGLGIAGIIAIFIITILSERENKYSLDDFWPSIFFFFVMLGITAGLFLGFIHKSLLLGMTGSLFGLIAGYSIGIYAGVWINYLGWIGALFIYISLLAIAGMVVVDLVFLFGLIF